MSENIDERTDARIVGYYAAAIVAAKENNMLLKVPALHETYFVLSKKNGECVARFERLLSLLVFLSGYQDGRKDGLESDTRTTV